MDPLRYFTSNEKQIVPTTNNVLQDLEVMMSNVRGDGNCFFNAIVDAIMRYGNIEMKTKLFSIRRSGNVVTGADLRLYLRNVYYWFLAHGEQGKREFHNLVMGCHELYPPDTDVVHNAFKLGESIDVGLSLAALLFCLKFNATLYIVGAFHKKDLGNISVQKVITSNSNPRNAIAILQIPGHFWSLVPNKGIASTKLMSEYWEHEQRERSRMLEEDEKLARRLERELNSTT